MNIYELRRDIGVTRDVIDNIKLQLAEHGENKKLQLRLKELQYLQLWRLQLNEVLGDKLSNIVEV